LQNFADLLLVNEQVEMGGTPKQNKPAVGYSCLGPLVSQIYIDFNPAAAKETNKPTDLMLATAGFFTVQTPTGKQYTRNGAFQVDGEGYLVTAAGDRVLGVNGPLQVGSEDFVVTKDGKIMVDNQKIDVLQIISFTNPQLLIPGENSYFYQPPQGAGIQNVGNPQVYQGFLEQANVELTNEMTKLIEVLRVYEANQRLVQVQDDLLAKAVSQIGSIK
jgi:flagellar basal-body rod protein FlgG